MEGVEWFGRRQRGKFGGKRGEELSYCFPQARLRLGHMGQVDLFLHGLERTEEVQ